jgi:iron complex outermembrane receptor protein
VDRIAHLLGGVSAVAMLLGGVSAARADDLEQVTVTGARVTDSSVGTKTDTPLVETPQSISIITGAEIELQGAQSLGEALRYAAGVNPEQYGGVDQRIDWFMVRGFPSSAPYIDGLNSNSRYTLLSPKVDPYGLDQIDVLRGPSSVLYGQNVPGGLINAVSKRPQETEQGELAIQTGSYGRIEGMADLTGPIDDAGTLLYRVTASALDSGTQVDHVGNHHYFVAPALTWRPEDGTSITFLSHFERQEDGFALQNLPAAGTLYKSPIYGTLPLSLFTGEPSLNDAALTQWDVGYNAEHRFSPDWTIHQNLRFTRSDLNLDYVAGYGQDSVDPVLMDRFALAAHAHQQNLALDTNVEGHVETGPVQHTLLVGVDYSHSHDYWAEADGSAAPLNLLHPVYGGPISLALDYITDDSLAQTGLYAQDQIKYDRLILTGSIRQDWAQTETIDLPTPRVPVVTELNQNNTAFTGRGGIVYLFDDGFAPYASYSSSFQPTIGTTFEGTPLKPTTATQWEAGVKYQPKGVASFAMLSAYSIDEQNVTTADPNPEHPNSEVQTGGARVRGIELSGDLDLGDGFSSNIAYTYMAPKITAANDGTVGNSLQDVARHSGSIWLDKSMEVLGGDRLTLGGGVRYIGSRYGDDANTLLLPANTQLDLMARYAYEHWEASLNVRNATDERVVATCDSIARCFYGDGRSFLAKIGYRW